MEKMKYVRLERYNEIIIFPTLLEHSTFKYLNPISAGFCIIDTKCKVVDCFGESISLKIKSDVQKDTLYATKQVFGFEN